MSISVTKHIRLDEAGVAWIDDTNVKVIEVVLDKHAHSSSPEEIHFQYPHLSLAQIYAALSYYHDHQSDFDAEIERQLDEFDASAARAGDSPVFHRLKRYSRSSDFMKEFRDWSSTAEHISRVHPAGCTSAARTDSTVLILGI